MNIQEMSFIESKVAAQKKSGPIAYLLWFFLGSLGAHRFYMGKTVSGIVMIAVTLLINWWMFFIPTAIWVIVDAFLIPGWLRENEARVRYNAQNELALYKQTDNTSAPSAVSVNIHHSADKTTHDKTEEVAEPDKVVEKKVFTAGESKEPVQPGLSQIPVQEVVSPVTTNDHEEQKIKEI
ncbi:TM2 domain-containing protein [Macrococcus hajekii]|uniref:TM2 domain-containing protein n=1 Tax=Macrococcus hajekii TaxID=198482 RepID=A0A4R6BLP6_9STAP|nr:TM2 domain-containing protein [Macrococcus hajekii]TDM02542.1 TM2 domain-containing protein [Macrococcus hajekii]GGB01806.1 hypothetical protein GCM10007190_07240 [Macrococcus hajekii]